MSVLLLYDITRVDTYCTLQYIYIGWVQALQRALRLATSFALFQANGNWRHFEEGENNKMTKYPSVSAKHGVLYKFFYSCSSLFLHRTYNIYIYNHRDVCVRNALWRTLAFSSSFLFFFKCVYTHIYIYI